MKLQNVECPVCGPVSEASVRKWENVADATFQQGQAAGYDQTVRKRVYTCECDGCGTGFRVVKDVKSLAGPGPA